MRCTAYWLGSVEYHEAYDMQKRMLASRLRGEMPDAILLLEHLPVFTIGKSGKQENVLVPRGELLKRGITLFFTDRGGDVTYHGPGQLVAYPIMDLRDRNKDLHRYVYELEEAIIRTLGEYAIEGCRDETHPGVWVEGDEIAAIGLSVKNWVTMHGISINVNPNMDHFSLIHPCGFTDRRATSIARILSVDIPIGEIMHKFVLHFSSVFGADLEWGSTLPPGPASS
jgi:lipoate-protein ligase B